MRIIQRLTAAAANASNRDLLFAAAEEIESLRNTVLELEKQLDTIAIKAEKATRLARDEHRRSVGLAQPERKE